MVRISVSHLAVLLVVVLWGNSALGTVFGHALSTPNVPAADRPQADSTQSAAKPSFFQTFSDEFFRKGTASIADRNDAFAQELMKQSGLIGKSADDILKELEKSGSQLISAAELAGDQKKALKESLDAAKAETTDLVKVIQGKKDGQAVDGAWKAKQRELERRMKSDGLYVALNKGTQSNEYADLLSLEEIRNKSGKNPAQAQEIAQKLVTNISGKKRTELLDAIGQGDAKDPGVVQLRYALEARAAVESKYFPATPSFPGLSDETTKAAFAKTTRGFIETELKSANGFNNDIETLGRGSDANKTAFDAAEKRIKGSYGENALQWAIARVGQGDTERDKNLTAFIKVLAPKDNDGNIILATTGPAGKPMVRIGGIGEATAVDKSVYRISTKNQDQLVGALKDVASKGSLGGMSSETSKAAANDLGFVRGLPGTTTDLRVQAIARIERQVLTAAVDNSGKLSWKSVMQQEAEAAAISGLTMTAPTTMAATTPVVSTPAVTAKTKAEPVVGLTAPAVRTPSPTVNQVGVFNIIIQNAPPPTESLLLQLARRISNSAIEKKSAPANK